MNRICNVRRESGGWLVEARTPEGMRVVVFDYGLRRRVIKSARWADAEPV